MNILFPQQSFIQSSPIKNPKNNEFENINMTYQSLDENNSTQSQNYTQLKQNNNYLGISLNSNKQINKNIIIKDKCTNIMPCSLIYSSTSLQASDFFYAFNILPINLNYLTGKQSFSFLSELNRGVDICEMSLDTQAVHILYQDIAILPQTFDLINNLNLTDERNNIFIKKIQQTAVITNNLNCQSNYCESSQMTFKERSKKVINTYFAEKKEKRMFALSSSYNSKTSRQQFSVHFSSEMINTLGYAIDSFMLKCSITGFDERKNVEMFICSYYKPRFMMKNDFLQNMELLIDGFSNQIIFSSKSEPIKIKQKFFKNQNEAMEAIFIVYLLQDTSIQNGAEQIIVFEIQHIIDFQVSTKGKKMMTKKHYLDTNEQNFLEKYLTTLSHQQNPSQNSDITLDETSGENGLDGQRPSSSVQKKKKGIAKQIKINQNLKNPKKRKCRKTKDFIQN